MIEETNSNMFIRIRDKRIEGDDSLPGMQSYNIEINKKVMVLTLVLSGVLSFFAGRNVAIHHVPHTTFTEDNASPNSSLTHPSLSLHSGKEPPLYKYSGIEFDAANTFGRAFNSHLPSADSSSQQICSVLANGEKQCVIDNTQNVRTVFDGDNEIYGKCSADDEENSCLNENGHGHKHEHDDNDDDEEEHLPSGQHLLIDIKNVDREFLNSDARLAKAMVGMVNASQLTILSYHCHNLIPHGVSCVGVLLESHISLHTWPEFGVITLDLFTCGSGKLVPLVPIVESLFAIPQVGSLVKPVMNWVHKLRGFRPDDDDDIYTKDIGNMLGETFDVRKEVRS